MCIFDSVLITLIYLLPYLSSLLSTYFCLDLFIYLLSFLRTMCCLFVADLIRVICITSCFNVTRCPIHFEANKND